MQLKSQRRMLAKELMVLKRKENKRTCLTNSLAILTTKRRLKKATMLVELIHKLCKLNKIARLSGESNFRLDSTASFAYEC